MAESKIIALNPKEKGIARNLDEWQVSFIRKRTPKSFIKTRPDGYNYVPGFRFRDALDHLFGGLWEFEVLERWRDGDDVIVHGRLIVHIPLPDGSFKQLKKDQFGTDHIETFGKASKRAGEPISIGNNYKSAATDALKKCAVDFGLFRDVYMNHEDAAMRNAEIDAATKAREEAAKEQAKATFIQPE